MRKWTRRAPFVAALVVLAAVAATTTASASGVPKTQTPIKHVVSTVGLDSARNDGGLGDRASVVLRPG